MKALRLAARDVVDTWSEEWHDARRSLSRRHLVAFFLLFTPLFALVTPAIFWDRWRWRRRELAKL